MDKQTSLSLFHFLLSQLIKECSEETKKSEDYVPELRIKEIGSQIGFKLYTKICIKRGITERPTTINEIFKNIKTKVFKHLFNYEANQQHNVYEDEQRKMHVYGIVDDFSIYLTWMPQNCWQIAGMLVAGIIQGICNSCDLKCSVNCRGEKGQKEDRTKMEYLVEVSYHENNRWSQ